MSLVQCNKCGWVHFPVTARYVRDWQADWTNYWPTLTAEGREMFGPPNADSYHECFRCGNSYKDFSPATKDAGGHTIQPILGKDETYVPEIKKTTLTLVPNDV